MLVSETGVPLRLYFQLEQGHTADLIVVSQASIAFAKGVKELAFILDPSLDLQIGTFPSEPGSLWQNTLLKAHEEIEKRKLLYQLAAASMIWFMQPPLERMRDNMWHPVLEKYIPDADAVEINQRSNEIQRLLAGNVAEQERQEAYRALSRDTGITGVGVNIEKKRPILIVPQSEFAAQSGRVETATTALDRTTVGPLRVILVSPVLEHGTRRWKFATAQGEFGAAIKDKDFLERTIRGQGAVPMRGGIEMDIQLETRERLVEGVWQIVERNVIAVDAVRAPPPDPQGALFSDNR